MSYADNLALAVRLIDSKGRTVTFDQLSAVPDDANKPWKPGAAGAPTVLTTHSLKAVFVPHTGLEDLGLKLVDAELLKRSEQVALVAGTNDLTAIHRITDGGTYWRVVWSRVLKPGDLTILYAFGVAR